MTEPIRLRGIRVHNLNSIDLDIPKNSLIGFCGPSGSGKSSLAVNTLFYEGQRRYLETFSTASRNLIDQPEKPEADQIDGVPPAIAIARSTESLNLRSTVGSATEILSYLQLAFSRFGEIYCPQCNIAVGSHSIDTVAQEVGSLADQTRLLMGFQWSPGGAESHSLDQLIANGFQRALVGNRLIRLQDLNRDVHYPNLLIIVDRLVSNQQQQGRIRESIETAFNGGLGKCFLLVDARSDLKSGRPQVVDGQSYQRLNFSRENCCPQCDQNFHRLSPNELSFQSPSGACLHCEGLGKTMRFITRRMIPHPHLSIQRGAALCLEHPPVKDPAALPAKHLLVEKLGDSSQLPFGDLKPQTQDMIADYCLEFLQNMNHSDTRKSTQAFLDRFRGFNRCAECDGTRLNANAMSIRLGGLSLAELCDQSIEELASWFGKSETLHQQKSIQYILNEIDSRLGYLSRVGVGYLSMNRELNSLSTGERQRVAMTNALGSQLVNMLYVLDEPSAGLHPIDMPRLIAAIKGLSHRGNTVIAVDHDLDLLLQSHCLFEFGPGAGIYGGKLVYAGDPEGIAQTKGSLTGDYIAGRRSFFLTQTRRKPQRGSVKLVNATGHNLKNLSVEFPLSLLCVVTGVSGSGKSTLVVDTLFPAICLQKNKPAAMPLSHEAVHGTGAIEDVLLVDHSPLGTTSRSITATYSKVFDAIRQVYSETIEARTRNLKSGHFSFNAEGGRCNSCKGEGTKHIDMLFLSNLQVKCRFCKGTRYKREILTVKYRDRHIAEVLEMTVREAFSFFRGKTKIQTKLKPLMDVGLDYLRLGQSAGSLSSGESQRLRLAGFLSSGKKPRTLFILDEPTAGLHYSDVVKLLDCFEALIAEGHSIIVVEHNKMMMSAADYLIDLGPGPAEKGGRVLVTGSPEQVALCSDSKTAQVLRTLQNQHPAENESN